MVIVGGGGHAREVLDVVDAMREAGDPVLVRGVVTETGADHELLAERGIRVLGGLDVVMSSGSPYVIAIGDGAVRRRIDRTLMNSGATSCPSLIHPTATLGHGVSVAPGVVVLAHASIACNARLGRHAHVHRAATVGHDSSLGPYSTVGPAAAVSGRVDIGEAVTLGTGSCVIEMVRVGSDTFVGAGAAVVDDLPEGVLAVGVPATTKGPAR